MSLNIHNHSYDSLIKAAEILTKEVQEIHTQSTKAGLSPQDLNSLKERVNKSRDDIKTLGNQIHRAMTAIRNLTSYSGDGSNDLLRFAHFAKASLAADEANLLFLTLAERNIKEYKP